MQLTYIKTVPRTLVKLTPEHREDTSSMNNGKNIIIYRNIDVTLFRTFSHSNIMMQKSGSILEVKGLGFNKVKLYQSDGRASRLRKSSTDIDT